MKAAIQFTLLFTLISISLTHAQNVGINTATPDASSLLDLNANNRGLLVPRISIVDINLATPVTAPATSLLVYNTNADVLNGSGSGFYYWTGASWSKLGKENVNNGLNFDAAASMIQLGGLLVENTSIEAATYQMNFNLNSTGDFTVQDNGTTRFSVQDNGRVTVGGTANLGNFNVTGTSYMSNDIYLRDGAVNSGDILLRLYDSFDDGVISWYENNAVNHRIHANNVSIFNEQGIATCDFRIESDLSNAMFFVDAGTNRIGINTLAPANQFQFIADGSTGWVTQWLNSTAAGGLKQVYNDNAANFSRTFMGITNYDASAYITSGIMGLSINNTITGTGGVGVTGAANNESGIAVYGSLFTTGSYSGWAGYFNADVYCTGTYFGSDRRLKRNIKPIMKALDLVQQLAPVSYFYDTDRYPQLGLDENRLTYGFIAQELELVLPELVKEKRLITNSNQLLTDKETSSEHQTDAFKVVNYTLMIPVLTQAIKEQQQLIEAQQQQIEQLKKSTTELKASMNH